MQIYIDESGTFSGYHDRSLSVVGALAIPDVKMGVIRKKYSRLRQQLPLQNGEVKGRLLNEEQISKVVSLLARNSVIFEVTVLDLGIHTEDEMVKRKEEHAKYMLGRLDRFSASSKQMVEAVSRQILSMSVPQYLQAIVTFDTLRNILNHVPTYFAQREPQELGAFAWIVDGKDPKKVTNWEKWWPVYATGALSTMSRKEPSPVLQGADYSHFERFDSKSGEEGTDLKALLADLRFSSVAEPGLELVDILVNATRRAFVGSLKKLGYRGISGLMVHRSEPYVSFIMLSEGAPVPISRPYAKILTQHFSTGGKSMLSSRFLRKAEEEEDG